MLKWVRWVVWERRKDVYFLKHEGREDRIKERLYPAKKRIFCETPRLIPMERIGIGMVGGSWFVDCGFSIFPDGKYRDRGKLQTLYLGHKLH